ncbi:AAA family ATPase [Mycobacteroides chelonae]|uniref:AAA family ATPase n=1 Tax=Mycobacteroides chelonae TaxID=1774 RepID=UPI002351C3D7|nr:AAA family ATPase [Mycobacteroides chelonae]
MGSGGGKDTMARIVADMYYGHGIVPEAKFTHISCAELIAAAAQEADSLAATFLNSAAKNADGGMLYLHDAQALSLRDWPRLTDQLVIEMENRRDSLAVILAADSSDAINRLRAVSPGLKARVLGISFPEPENLN